jgi:cytochrome oxidase assembly protein ShyY1
VKRNGSRESYRKDEDERIVAVLADWQVQRLCEQVTYQTACAISSESDGLVSPECHRLAISS